MAGLMYLACGCVYDSSPYCHVQACEQHPFKPRGHPVSTTEFVNVFRNQVGEPKGKM